jgi:hypothetical protein
LPIRRKPGARKRSIRQFFPNIKALINNHLDVLSSLEYQKDKRRIKRQATLRRKAIKFKSNIKSLPYKNFKKQRHFKHKRTSKNYSPVILPSVDSSANIEPEDQVNTYELTNSINQVLEFIDIRKQQQLKFHLDLLTSDSTKTFDNKRGILVYDKPIWHTISNSQSETCDGMLIFILFHCTV